MEYASRLPSRNLQFAFRGSDHRYSLWKWNCEREIKPGLYTFSKRQEAQDTSGWQYFWVLNLWMQFWAIIRQIVIFFIDLADYIGFLGRKIRTIIRFVLVFRCSNTPRCRDKKISRMGKMKFAVNSPHLLRFISRILLYLQSKRIDHVYSSNGRLATFLVG